MSDETTAHSPEIARSFNQRMAEIQAEYERDEAEARDDQPTLADAWDEGYRAAREVVELDGVKCWAHTVMPEGYEGNPYRIRPERTHDV